MTRVNFASVSQIYDTKKAFRKLKGEEVCGVGSMGGSARVAIKKEPAFYKSYSGQRGASFSGRDERTSWGGQTSARGRSTLFGGHGGDHYGPSAAAGVWWGVVQKMLHFSLG